MASVEKNNNSLMDDVDSVVAVGEDMALQGPSDTSIVPVYEAEVTATNELDDELKKLEEIQNELQREYITGPLQKSIKADFNSVYVGNVDYGTTDAILKAHFHGCGIVKRVTIPVNKFNGTPKGFAYIEFSEPSSVELAMTLDQSLLRGRKIKVVPKRTNKPGFSTNRPPRSDAFSYHSRGTLRPSRDYTGRIPHTRSYGGVSRFTPQFFLGQASNRLQKVPGVVDPAKVLPEGLLVLVDTAVIEEELAASLRTNNNNFQEIHFIVQVSNGLQKV
ncbi:PREDICTED: polyadenylate-binding protein 2-like [Nicrophorus vespilloides]|uniref:Polyadenylate-binding protein 2-like n=1 Tax=Nicrophorus vespilloides TaxID=110193 RepID=A0ABM1MRT5_NICVS|nr:PREDICTED: polyadenylate-binding protein 2-like [Nicrophorus vespilloides]